MVTSVSTRRKGCRLARGVPARGAARLRAPGDGRDVALGPRPTTPRASRKCSRRRAGAQGTRFLAVSWSVDTTDQELPAAIDEPAGVWYRSGSDGLGMVLAGGAAAGLLAVRLPAAGRTAR